ncbi:hypothetical protein BKA80DRAFT_258073 [Phyllosticta citrichinensis]
MYRTHLGHKTSNCFSKLNPPNYSSPHFRSSSFILSVSYAVTVTRGASVSRIVTVSRAVTVSRSVVVAVSFAVTVLICVVVSVYVETLGSTGMMVMPSSPSSSAADDDDDGILGAGAAVVLLADACVADVVAAVSRDADGLDAALGADDSRDGDALMVDCFRACVPVGAKLACPFGIDIGGVECTVGVAEITPELDRAASVGVAGRLLSEVFPLAVAFAAISVENWSGVLIGVKVGVLGELVGVEGSKEKLAGVVAFLDVGLLVPGMGSYVNCLLGVKSREGIPVAYVVGVCGDESCIEVVVGMRPETDASAP